MKVVDYKVLREFNPKRIADAVMEKVADGWQPLGGLSVALEAGGYSIYAQAMVKYEEKVNG